MVRGLIETFEKISNQDVNRTGRLIETLDYAADFFFKGKCNQGCVNFFVNCSAKERMKNCDFMLVRAMSIFRKAKSDTRIKLTMDIFDIVAI